MSRLPSQALAIARPAIQVLMVLNLLYGLGILALFIASYFIASWPQPLGIDLATMHPWLPFGIRVVEVLGLVGAGLVYLILRRLLALVDSVRGGDPFVVENARRLQVIAWCLLGVEVLRVLVTLIGNVVGIPKLGDAGFSVVPWFAILLLFVLSGVFTHGARMRADLEGTV